MGMNATAVQRLYVAYFNRPADPISLAVYEAMLPTDTAATQAELLVLAETYFSPSAEYTTNFAGMSNAQVVDQLYQNIFGRSAEAAGLTAWAVALTDGTQTVASLALQLSYSAQGTDGDTVNNRITAAASFTTGVGTADEITGYSGDAAAASAKTWLATVTDDASLVTATAGVDTAISNAVSAGNVAAGSTYNLTAAVDTFTGTSGNDTFNGDDTGIDTISTADVINGGTAGSDVFNMFSDGAAMAIPQMSNIETVNLYDQDANYDISTMNAAVTTVNMIRGDGGTLTLSTAVDTVGLTDLTLASVGNTTDDTVVTFGATTTAATLNLSGVTTAAGNADENIDLDGAALATVTINAVTASAADDIDVASATTININATGSLTATSLTTGGTAAMNISGAGAVTLGTLDQSINTVTSTGSGAVTAAIGAATDTVFTGGSANDVITASTTDTIAASGTLAVDAAGGTGDILILADGNDVNTVADGARYTNFETIRTATSYDMDLVAGITSLQLVASNTQSFTDLTAGQAGNVAVLGDLTSGTIALATATGTSDALTLAMGTGLTTAAATDVVTTITVTGFETLNVVENGGPTAAAGADRTAIIAAVTGATLNDINLSGRAVTISNLATTSPVDIDGTALTGNGNASTAGTIQGLTVAGSAVGGSTIRGSQLNDSMTIGAEGSTYNGNGGNDAFSATMALINADGSTDLVINGGEDTDTLTLTNTTALTMADTHFTNLSNMEGLTLTNTGAADTSITTGAAFNAAFANGATITSGIIAAGQDITLAGGLSTVDTTVTIAATAQTGAATETNSITTGSGADTVTYTDTGFVGVANAAQGSITIDTRAGNDTISVTVGTGLAVDAASISQLLTVTPGAGTDSLTKVGTNADFGLSGMVVNIAAGDSSTSAWDTITGFDLTTANTFSDALNFEGTAAVSDFTATVDFGVIQSHTHATAGIITFDDTADFSTALVISATNIADVVGYLKANAGANDVAAFAYDADGDGAADGTMVFHQSSSAGVADDMVYLAGVTADVVLIVNASAGANDLFVS
jgi:S-layer protein